MLEEFLRWKRFLQKALWCLFCHKKYDQPHMTCRYCSSIFLGAIFLIVQHVVNEASYDCHTIDN